MSEENKWGEWFYYDETSPSCLRWKVDRYWGRNYVNKRISAGDATGGSRNRGGYYIVQLHEKTLLVHRIIWEMHTGERLKPSVKVDHEDGDNANNRFGNLRKCSQAINMRNAKMYKTNTTGTTGVYLSLKGYWVAMWMEKDGKQASRSFSIRKYGAGAARSLAEAARAAAIERMNAAGAGYTERHGQ